MSNIKKLRCSMCGGDCENGICLYCGNKNLDVEKIKELIDGTNNIEKYYEEEIRAKLFQGIKLSKIEDEVFRLLLEKDMINDEGLDDARILSYILREKKIISYDTFEYLMIRSAEKSMRMLNDGRIKNYSPSACIKKMEGANGSAVSCYVVKFNKLIITQLYEGYIYPLTTYYHELQHILQAILFQLGYVSYDLMIMLKEVIIKEYEYKNYKTDYYYKDNYYDISYEVDAHQKGIDYVQRLLSIIGFNSYEDYLNKIKKTWPESKGSLDRIIRKDGQKIHKTVDEIFDSIIVRDPSFIDEFPQLKLEYVYENGMVRKRNIDELTNMIMNCLGQKELCDYLEQLIEKLKKEDKFVK